MGAPVVMPVGAGTTALSLARASAAVGRAPAITSAWRVVTPPGTAMTPFTVTATGSPRPTLAASGLPSGVRFTDNRNGTGAIAGTPDPARAGQYHVIITASNRYGTSRQSFDLAVIKVASRRTLLLLAGQSNATGSGSYATDPTTGTDYLAPPYTNGADVSSTISWMPWTGYPAASGGDPTGQVPLDTPQWLVETNGERVQTFGPEIGWARQVFSTTGQSVTVVKAAFEGTSLAADWSPANPSSLFAKMIARVAAIMSADARSGQLDTIRGIAWYQGEADAQHLARADQYRSNLATFINDLRFDLPLAPTVPIVLVKESLASVIAWNQQSGACSTTPVCSAWTKGDTEVRAADDWVASHLPGVLEIDSLGLPRSAYLHIHLTNTSELTIGREIADAIARAGAQLSRVAKSHVVYI